VFVTLSTSFHRRARGLASALIPVALLAVTACSDAPTSAPALESPSAAARAVVASAPASTLLECAPSTASSASKLITPAGGMIASGGHAIAIPPRAVSRPTRITMTVPASRFVEVDISAEGRAHYQFARPVVITLDYSRCGASADAIASSFTAWYVDASTRTFMADMGGVDDRLFRRIFFTTDHLSGYAVAYRAGQGGAPDASE
jgi:hypothetical protein